MRPVDLKYCIEVDYLESTIELGFIPNAKSFKTITDAKISSFFEGLANESKKVATLAKRDKMVSDELRTDMKNNDATTRMQDLFSKYHDILRMNSLKWIIEDNQKMKVAHVLSAI